MMPLRFTTDGVKSDRARTTGTAIEFGVPASLLPMRNHLPLNILTRSRTVLSTYPFQRD